MLCSIADVEADITENLEPYEEPDCFHCERLNEMIAKLKAELDRNIKELQAERQVCRKCFVVFTCVLSINHLVKQ